MRQASREDHVPAVVVALTSMTSQSHSSGTGNSYDTGRSATKVPSGLDRFTDHLLVLGGF
jgi:hypothetical protein